MFVGRTRGITARKSRALTLAVSGLAGLSIAGMAHAAEDAATTVSGLDVEASRLKPVDPKVTAEPLNNPQTVTVVPRGVLEAQNLLSLRDVLSIVPGITFGAGEGGGGYGDSINLRGFSANNDITTDGVRDSAQYTRSDSFNIEQIEVTNGANSVYSGAGSVGGTINIATKRPGRRDSTTVQAGIGTENYYRATIDANKLIGDNVAVRLNGMVHRMDAPGRDVEQFKRWGIAPSVTIGLNGPTQFTVLYHHQEDNNVPQYGVPFYNGRPVDGVSPHRYYGYSNIDEQRLNLDVITGIIDHDFGDGLKLRNLARYQDVRQTSVVDPPQGVFCLPNGLKPVGWSQTTTATNLTGYTACLPTDPAPGFYQPSGPRGSLRDTKNTLLYNQTDLSWEGELGGVRHTIVVGAAFLREEFNLDTGNLFRTATGATVALPPMNIANPANTYVGAINYMRSSIQDGSGSNQAVYLFDNIELNDQWSINGGIRYEHNSGWNRTDTYSTVVGPTLGTVAPGRKFKNSENLLTYRIGVVYKPIPNASLYISYANSKTPSQATVNGSGACTAFTCTVDPETAKNLEIGAKWDIDGRLSLTAAIFQNERINYKVPAVDPVVQPQQTDGEARVRGVALGASGRITDEWSIFANYTYLDSEVIRGVNKTFAAQGLDWAKGDPLLSTPKHAFSLFTTYDLPNRIQVGYGVTYQGEYYLTQHGAITGSVPLARTTIPLVKADDYWTHRAMVTWAATDQLAVQLNVENIFDKVYFQRGRNNGWATPGDRRNARLTASYRF
jgi:catecholate siderophore receptor